MATIDVVRKTNPNLDGSVTAFCSRGLNIVSCPQPDHGFDFNRGTKSKSIHLIKEKRKREKERERESIFMKITSVGTTRGQGIVRVVVVRVLFI